MTIVGVDPGGSGGLAVFRPCGSVKLFGFKGREYDKVVDEALAGEKEVIVFFEKVGGYVGRDQPGSAMFNFGNANGIVHGLLLGRLGSDRIRFVTPQVWQKDYPAVAAARKAIKTESLTVGDSFSRASSLAKSAGKKALCAEAKRLFPHLKVTMQNCDALLIATYGHKLLHPSHP